MSINMAKLKNMLAAEFAATKVLATLNKRELAVYRKVMPNKEVAVVKKWFHEMSPLQRKKYLDAHPASSLSEEELANLSDSTNKLSKMHNKLANLYVGSRLRHLYTGSRLKHLDAANHYKLASKHYGSNVEGSEEMGHIHAYLGGKAAHAVNKVSPYRLKFE